MSSKPKLTIVQVLPALTTGGVERGAIDLSTELLEKGFRPLIISEGGELTSELYDLKIEHIPLEIGRKKLSTLLLIRRLSEIFLNEKVNVIHARSRLPAWISKLALNRIKGIRKISWLTTVHGPYTVNPYSKIMTSGEKVIAVSDFIKNYILCNYNIDPEKIVTIPRGIDVKKYYPKYKPDKDWFDCSTLKEQWLVGKPILTLPGRLTRWKGQEQFINLLFNLKNRGLEFHGLIVGGAHKNKIGYREFLQKKIETLGLSNQVTILGNRKDLRQIMAISKVTFSLTQKPEAFGRTTAESLSLGTPVIGYNHGGTGEILKKWFPSGLVNPFMINEAADRVAMFLQEPQIVPPENPFPLQNMLDSTIKIYQEISDEKHK